MASLPLTLKNFSNLVVSKNSFRKNTSKTEKDQKYPGLFEGDFNKFQRHLWQILEGALLADSEVGNIFCLGGKKDDLVVLSAHNILLWKIRTYSLIKNAYTHHTVDKFTYF